MNHESIIKFGKIENNKLSKEFPINKKFPDTKNLNTRKNFIVCDPAEVIIYSKILIILLFLILDIEKNKLYEIMIKVQNYSESSKNITINNPKYSFFELYMDSKNNSKSNQFTIAPGMFIKLTAIFKCFEVKDYIDYFEITSESNYKLIYKLKALQSNEVVLFEPILNLGFCSTNTAKTDYIQFINEGSKEVEIEIRNEKAIHPDLTYYPSTIKLHKNITDKEYEEVLLIKNKDEKEREKLKELTLLRTKNKGKLFVKFE